MPPIERNAALRRVLGGSSEIVRFLMTGGIATLINMGIVWICRGYLSAAPSIALGLVGGMCASFMLMKFFAFKSSDWSGGWGEAARFLCVYLIGTLAYVAAAMAAESLLSGTGLPERLAAIGGVFTGGLVMAVTSYVGHRHYTYRRTTSDSKP